MRYQALSICFALSLLCLSFSSFAQGIEFYKGSFEEALEQAKVENKLVFVDAYTTWCGPCKRLAKNVFPKPEVGEYYNSNFICVKLDMDKKENFDFRQNYMVTAYPTLLYINGDGKLVHKALGGRDVKGFIKEGQKAYISNPEILANYEKKYAEGERDPGFVRDYIITSFRAGSPNDEVLETYLKSQSVAELVSEENTNLIFLTATHLNSVSLPCLLEDEELYRTRFGSDKFDSKITGIAENSLRMAVKDTNEILYNQVTSFLKKHKPSDYKERLAYCDVEFSKGTGDLKGFSKASKKYFKKYGKEGDDQSLRNTAIHLIKFGDDQYLSEAAAYADQALEIKDSYENNYVKALILFKQGDFVDAKVLAEYAITRANKEKKFAGEAMNLVNEINQKLVSAEQ